MSTIDSYRELGNELLGQYAISGNTDSLLCDLWEYQPSALVGIMRQWWFGTTVSGDFTVTPFHPDKFSDMRAVAFAEKFCVAMATDDEEKGYALARKFASEADFTEMVVAMEKIAQCVLEARRCKS